MNYFKKIVTLLLLIVSMYNYAQLGFCNGSKGDPIFSETFGNGTNYGPALPSGITNYTFITGNPNDGFYTLFYRTNLYSTWHYSLDHSPDVTDGANGKALIVNADASTSGDFYKRSISGLCINTTFEFSAWLMNIYNPGSNYCGAGEIPINVRFEIWNDTETVLLGSGNTGNIIGTSTPIWQQFALVFTTSTQTSVVLKMKNNGLGGCGNDLAIDDIEFRSCGDLTTITSPSATGNSYSTCNTPTSIQLQATTAGALIYFYQWQTSTDGITWTDVPGATNSNYTTTNLTTQTYYRTKVSQDIANLNNSFCSTLSDTFTISFLAGPNNAVTDGDKTICSNEPIPALSVAINPGTGVNWYSAAAGGTLLLANSTTYTPTVAGTYYAEVYNLTTNCKSNGRTPVTLTIIALPTASISGTASICSGNTATINFNGTPNATVNYNVNGGSNQTIQLDSSGFASLITTNLTSNSNYSLVSVVSSVLNTCSATLNNSVLITVNPTPTATITGSSSVCSGTSTTLTISGTPNAIVTYAINSGGNQNISLNASGSTTLTTASLTTTTTFTLVSITSNGLNGCTNNLSQIFTITPIALPTATISANPISICSGGTSTLNFSGTPNAIITFTQDGGTNQTVTLNASGLASITVSNITSNANFQLVNANLPSSLCSQLLSNSVTISINPIPTASFSGNLNYCSNETINLSLSSDIAGTTFTWTVLQNGTTGAASGSGDTITQILSANTIDGTATYYVTPSLNGCAGATIEINVIIHALPNPAISDGAICSNSLSTPASQFYTLTTGLNANDYSFEWYFEGVIIPTANGNTYDAYQIGSYSVIATNILTSCISNEVFATIVESIQGESLIITQSETFSNNPIITITVIGGQGPFLYQLDDLPFQTSNVFFPSSTGTHAITVVDETYCTNLFATVTIINYPHYFTPNGDGINDTWNIKGLGGNFEIFIFDRFGKLLQQIFTNGSGWDGTYNNTKSISDDYWFTLNYIENGANKTFKNHFTLKR